MTTKTMTNDISNRFKRRGNELLEGAQDKSERALRNSRNWISNHPGKAVGYAFLTGAVLSLIFGRRRSVVREY